MPFTGNPQDLDTEATITVVFRSEVAGAIALRADVSLAHEQLDPEDPRAPDDVVLAYRQGDGPKLGYLADTLERLAETLRGAAWDDSRQ